MASNVIMKLIAMPINKHDVAYCKQVLSQEMEGAYLDDLHVGCWSARDIVQGTHLMLRSYCKALEVDMLLTPFEVYLLANVLATRCTVMIREMCVCVCACGC